MIEKDIFSRWYQLSLLVIFGLQSLALGFYQFKKKSPFVMNGKLLSYSMFFLTLPGPLYWSVRGYILHDSIAVGVVFFSLYFLLWALFASFFGDLVAFNIDEGSVRRAIEKVCDDESISYADGPTTGLLAPGGETKFRSIVTLNLNTSTSNTPIRYFFAKRRNIVSIKVFQKQFFKNWPTFLKAIEKEMRNQPIASGRSYMYSIFIGCLLFVLAYLKVIQFNN